MKLEQGRHWLLMLSLLMATACSSITVSSDYDPKADYSAYRTYDWAPRAEQPVKDPVLDNALLDGRIRHAVETELAAKGLEKDGAGKPDLLIAYHVAVQGKLDIAQTPNYSYGPYWRYGSYAGSSAYVRQYDEGTLILDLIDVSTKQLVWRGSAQAEVKKEVTPEEQQRRINEVVRKILERYPPKPKLTG
jgi:hypothetical protein